MAAIYSPGRNLVGEAMGLILDGRITASDIGPYYAAQVAGDLRFHHGLKYEDPLCAALYAEAARGRPPYDRNYDDRMNQFGLAEEKRLIALFDSLKVREAA